MPEPFEAEISRMTHEGRGVTEHNERTIYVSGALPGETATIEMYKRWSGHGEAKTLEVHAASDERVNPPCEYASLCGGCALQHWGQEHQVAHKEGVLRELLSEQGCEAETELVTLRSQSLGYRRKARMGVRWVPAKGRVLVGFREKGSGFLANIKHCEVLDPRVGRRLDDISQAIGKTSIRSKVAQIEVACGDQAVALVFRVLEPPAQTDLGHFVELGKRFGFHIWLQPKGPETSHRIWPLAGPEWLSYEHPDYGLRLRFHPHDFTQVNSGINRLMVKQALELLELDPQDRVLDLFCGLGNFTLPLATQVAKAVGVEGSEAMTQRGRMNARGLGLDNAEFHAADLTQPIADKPWAQEGFNKLLLDPARSGALDVIQAMDLSAFERIVYVSCNPVTLARDTQLLRDKGFKLAQAGIMDMFPHTAHVESMAVFVPQD